MEDINRDWKKAEMLTSTPFKEIFIWHDIRSEDFPLKSYQEWIIEEKTNRREGKGKKSKWKVPRPYQKKHKKQFLSKKKDKVKSKRKKWWYGKNRKDSKSKIQISQGGVTRPPSQFESYSLSTNSKSYTGRSYSAPKPDWSRAPTIAARPSRNYIFNKHKISV